MRLQESLHSSRRKGPGNVCASERARRAWHSLPTTVMFALSCVTVFLLAHPYRGIWQDAVLYTVQAVRDVHPEHFTHDLFFQFGSQDDWTLYGKLYERLIGLLGIRAANLVGLAAAQGLWWTGMWRLTRRLVPAPWHWVCLMLVAGMPSDYGEWAISYNEFFLSGRLPAEALCLWGMAFVLEGRSIAALSISLVAMSIHPLIGAVGFAVLLLIATPQFPWWRVFAVTLPLFAITQFFTPSSWAIHPFDPAWLRVVRTEVSMLFPSRWDPFAWSKTCWVLALPLLLIASETTQWRRVWASLALVGVAGVSVSVVADLAGHDAFWTQVQPWRVLWLVSVMQWVAVATLVQREWNKRPVLLWLLAICWLGLEFAGGGFFALAIAALVHVDRVMALRGKPLKLFGQLTPSYKVCLVAVTLGAAALGLLFQMYFSRARAEQWLGTLNLDLPWLEAVIHTRLVVLLVAVLSVASMARDRVPSFLQYLLLVLLCGYALVNIDQRSPTAKILEADLDNPQRAPFVGRVAPGQMVYWDGPTEEIVYPWLLMKTASYFSSWQAAGMIFHRQTTFEALRREAVIDRPDPRSQRRLMYRDAKSFKPLTQEGIVRVCREPNLSFVVSPLHYPALSTNDAWVASPHSTYWLYDCRQIDSKSASGLPNGR